MRSLDSGFTLSFFFLSLCALAAFAAAEFHCPKQKDGKLKELRVYQVISSINKPVPNELRESYGVIDRFRLSKLGRLPKRQIFSLFDERNWNETSQVIDLLLEAEDFDEFIKRSEVIKPLVNEELFFYAFSVALIHRKDTQGLHVPRVHLVFPDKFLKTPVIQRLRKLPFKTNQKERSPIVMGNDLLHEHNYYDTHDELAYFTEDLGMNAHHYHWHVINSPLWKTKYGNYSARKGELFYWMHRQMVARYDVERMANNLPRIRPFQSLNDEIEEGYNPQLTMAKTQYHYAYRPPGFTLKDLPRLPKSKMQEWSNSLFNAIHTGYLLRENGTRVPLNNERGIDYLANTIEANYDSVNPRAYGNLHCYAHVIASKITDPQGAYNEDSGVMYDVATSARDPLFYRWHKLINRFFMEHKKMLKPYTKEDLNWDQVKVEKVTIQNPSSDLNLIRTFWQDAYFRLTQGFVFTPETSAYVKLTHLDHETFEYKIDVDNKASSPKMAVVRIFMAPTHDEFEHMFDFKDQVPLMIQMDKFVTKLNPGKNTIIRSSENSSVTMDSRALFEPSYKIKSQGLKDNCRCGWPDYLLVPKGTYEGMEFELFVTLTDWSKDEAETSGSCLCKDSFSYCGGIDAKYKDKRPMGYPFDRHIAHDHFSDWKTDNMVHEHIKVKFMGSQMSKELKYDASE